MINEKYVALVSLMDSLLTYKKTLSIATRAANRPEHITSFFRQDGSPVTRKI